MPKICYVEKNFRVDSLIMINRANEIIDNYQAQGYILTLRQLYYQFVSRDLLKNDQKNYSKLGSVINDARLAGLIDWESIEDRTRAVAANSHWDSPADIIKSAARSYATDKWKQQKDRIEVWVEKEALAGVFERICNELDVSHLACRGYVSQSEMWRAARRLKRWEGQGYTTHILHFGDHDPSGIDMTRDIIDRLSMFGSSVTVERLALTYEQVQQYQPPPNPAKATDSRFESYQQEYGDESWELDALEPRVLVDLVREGVYVYRDVDRWDEAVKQERRGQRLLVKTSSRWSELEGILDTGVMEEILDGEKDEDDEPEDDEDDEDDESEDEDDEEK